MPSLVTYLAAILTRGQGHDHRLDQILHKLDCIQRTIMASQADVQERLTALTAKVGEIAPSLTQISEGIANVASDIQTLKDQVGTVPVGITPEEADGFVASLDTTLGTLGTAVQGLQTAASALQSVADAQ